MQIKKKNMRKVAFECLECGWKGRIKLDNRPKRKGPTIGLGSTVSFVTLVFLIVFEIGLNTLDSDLLYRICVGIVILFFILAIYLTKGFKSETECPRCKYRTFYQG